MSKHTPGPWKVSESHSGAVWVHAGDDWQTGTVAKVIDDVCVDANARLIAAAPDLLAALEALLSETRGSRDVRDSTHAKAREAIAKATGGTP